jgi:uncharacterized membrane protein YfcA
VVTAETLLDLWPADLSMARYIGMALMVGVGACLQGVGGLGFAMFCAPLAALCFPELVPGPLIALACPLSLMAALREHPAIDWRAASTGLAGRVLGTAGAALCLALLSADTLSLLFALLILAAVGLSLGGWKVAPSPRNVAIAGVASGVMGTITSAGAPPFAIAMQHLQADRLRATLGCIFFAGSTVSIAMLVVVDRMGLHELLLALWLGPWMVLGFAASGHLGRLLQHRSPRPFLLGLAACGAFGILAQRAFSP